MSTFVTKCLNYKFIIIISCYILHILFILYIVHFTFYIMCITQIPNFSSDVFITDFKNDKFIIIILYYIYIVHWNPSIRFQINSHNQNSTVPQVIISFAML